MDGWIGSKETQMDKQQQYKVGQQDGKGWKGIEWKRENKK